MPIVIESFAKAIQDTALVSAPNNVVIVERPTGVQEGDLLLAGYGRDNADSFPVGVPAGWTRLYDRAQGSAGRVYGTIAWKIADAIEPPTYTFGENLEGTVGVILLRISGHDPSSPVNAHGVIENGGVHTNWNVPNIVTTLDNCLILHFAVVDGSNQNFVAVPQTEIATYDLNQPYPFGTGQALAISISTRGIQAAAGVSETVSYEVSSTDQLLPFTIAIAPYVPPPPIEVDISAELTVGVMAGRSKQTQAALNANASMTVASAAQQNVQAHISLSAQTSLDVSSEIQIPAPLFRTVGVDRVSRAIRVPGRNNVLTEKDN